MTTIDKKAASVAIAPAPSPVAPTNPTMIQKRGRGRPRKSESAAQIDPKTGKPQKAKYGRKDARPIILRRLHLVARRIAKDGDLKRPELARLKLIMEMLSKLDDTGGAKGRAPALLTQEEMTAYVRRLLGKEITL